MLDDQVHLQGRETDKSADRDTPCVHIKRDMSNRLWVVHDVCMRLVQAKIGSLIRSQATSYNNWLIGDLHRATCANTVVSS